MLKVDEIKVDLTSYIYICTRDNNMTWHRVLHVIRNHQHVGFFQRKNLGCFIACVKLCNIHNKLFGFHCCFTFDIGDTSTWNRSPSVDSYTYTHQLYVFPIPMALHQLLGCVFLQAYIRQYDVILLCKCVIPNPSKQKTKRL